MAEVDQSYRQLGTGRFHASYRLVRLNGITAFEESTYPEVVERGWLEPGTMFVFPMYGSGEAWFCGRPLEPGQFALFDGPREFMLRTPKQLQLGVLMLQREFISLTFGPAAPSVVGDYARIAVGRSREESRAIAERFAAIMRVGVQPEAGEQLPLGMQRELIDDLQRLVLRLMPMDETRLCSKSTARTQEWIVSQALDVIHGSVADGLAVYDVCVALQVSRRYLQRCFEAVLDINPAQYILRQRLLAARSLLLSRADDQGAVAAAATECGFWHLGRFAHYYRQMFGEYPRQTRRSQSPAAGQLHSGGLRLRRTGA